MKTLLTQYYIIILILLSGNLTVQAQSYGDPVVEETFGAGTTKFAGALPSGTTSYGYVAQDFPNDGYYTVSNGIANSTWHNITDHTGNTGGYMMVVNASTSITDYFFRTTVTDLCPNTSYLFGAWVINLLKSQDNSLPNLTFTIENINGTILGTKNTGDIALSSSPVWKEFTMEFTTPADVSSVVLRIRNNKAGAAPGNDIALDDITFRAYGPKIEAGFNSITSGISTINICEGESVNQTLNASVSTGYATPKFQWQQNINDGGWTDIADQSATTYNLNLLSATKGKYQYRLAVGETANFSSANCRIYSDVLTVNVNELPVATASSNSPICNSESLNLRATGGTSFLWTGPNGFSSTLQNPVINNIQPNMSGTYSVQVSNSSGCSTFATTDVSIGTLPNVSATGDATICEGESTQLNAFGGTIFKWTPEEGLSDASISNPVASPQKTTQYIVEISNPNEICSGFDTVVVTVINPAIVNAGNTIKTIVNNPVQLKGSISGTDISFYWSPADNLDDPYVLNPTATLTKTTTYTLNVISNRGCITVTDSVQIIVYDKIQIPNVFSPNGDGVNDVWNIVGLETYAKASLKVFNRYGGLVHNVMPYQLSWDGTYQGKPLVSGVYYYIINLNDGSPLISGWVMISH